MLNMSSNKSNLSRRKFIKSSSLIATLGFNITQIPVSFPGRSIQKGKRIGMIGLDTSHSIVFTKAFNLENHRNLLDYKIVAAYPYGSRTIEDSYKRIPGYTEEVKSMGVEIVDSIDELIDKIDVILLETNDGHPHYEQILPVIRAGKRVFVDKPIAGSLDEVVKIYSFANNYNVPIFSTSGLRYMKVIESIKSGEIDVGRVLGANTWSAAYLEETHPDMFWYGIHGIEALFAIMGTGCTEVRRVYKENTDIITGIWNDDRVGVFRGIRSGKVGYGGAIFGEKKIIDLGGWPGYLPLLEKIAQFFDSGIAPVPYKETLEIYSFMAAADISKNKNGKGINIDKLISKNLKKFDL